MCGCWGSWTLYNSPSSTAAGHCRWCSRPTRRPPSCGSRTTEPWVTPAPARSRYPRAMCLRLGEQPPVHFIIVIVLCSRQAAHSLKTCRGPSFLRASSVTGTLPGHCARHWGHCLNRDSLILPRASSLEGKTDAGHMTTQMFSCPCDGWGQQEAALEEKRMTREEGARQANCHLCKNVALR